MDVSTGSSPTSSDGFVAQNLAGVLSRIESAIGTSKVRLVAVSKTKPNAMLMEAYDAGQRVFGENYVQELCGKASELPKDIRWHFIGPLQSNKAASLVKSVGLAQLGCVETVSSLKLAKKLDKAVMDCLVNEAEGDANDGNVGVTDDPKKLSIYLQVNTSGEESKSGVSPGGELTDLVESIQSECSHLWIRGLMTIGAPGDLSCFDTLVQCRADVAKQMNLASEGELDLSMGMSGDFEDAIARGATSVRVGSTIFGARDYSNK